MLRRRLAPVLVAISVDCVVVSAAQSRTTLQLDFDEWYTAVRQHVPTQNDAPLKAIAQWPWARLKPVLGHAFDRGDLALLLRGALLHADISYSIPIDHRTTPGIGSVVLALDGQAVGVTNLDPHLWWARRLLDRITPNPPEWKQAAPLLVGWYRAVAAVLANRMWFADLEGHLQRGLDRFPEDAGLQFDMGCLNESLVTPAVMAAMPKVPQRTTLPAAHQDSFSPVRRLYQAEQHFARAVERDPSFAEARVRLARVMHMRGRLEPALEQLQKADALSDSDVVRYYNEMFLARALAAGGNAEGARKAYKSAALLFPHATGPRLGMAHLALLAGNASDARRTVDDVLAQPGRGEQLRDPMWQYHLCAGRDPATSYARLLRTLPPLQ